MAVSWKFNKISLLWLLSVLLKQLAAFGAGVAILDPLMKLLAELFWGWHLGNDSNDITSLQGVGKICAAFLIGQSGLWIVNEYFRGKAMLLEWFRNSTFVKNDRKGIGSKSEMGRAETIKPLLELIEYTCSKVPTSVLFKQSGKKKNDVYKPSTSANMHQKPHIAAGTILEECIKMADGHTTKAPKALYYFHLQALMSNPKSVNWKIAVWKTSKEEITDLTSFIKSTNSISESTARPSTYNELDSAILAHYLYHLEQLYPILNKECLVLIYVNDHERACPREEFKNACASLFEAFRSLAGEVDIKNIYAIPENTFVNALKCISGSQHRWHFNDDIANAITDYHVVSAADGNLYSIAALPRQVKHMLDSCEIFYQKSANNMGKKTKIANEYIKDVLKIDLSHESVDKIQVN